MTLARLEQYRDLLGADKKAFAHLGTLLADGGPHVTPMWFDYDGAEFRFNSARGRVKVGNMARSPRVAFSIVDPDNAYRYVLVQGRVVEVTEEGADAHIDRLARKYLGQDRYPWRRPGEVRVMFRVRPERASGMG
jgi:PPOX class probable F420-dependent enzyme